MSTRLLLLAAVLSLGSLAGCAADVTQAEIRVHGDTSTYKGAKVCVNITWENADTHDTYERAACTGAAVEGAFDVTIKEEAIDFDTDVFSHIGDAFLQYGTERFLFTQSSKTEEVDGELVKIDVAVSITGPMMDDPGI